MSEHQASRTLLKSPPELWAECSDAQSLARHLDEFFGEIRITRLEPEQAVAWEGERVSGTVKLEPSGWGTKVTLTAVAPELEAAEPAEPLAVEPEPLAVEPEPFAVRPEPDHVPEPATPRPVPAPPAPRPVRMGFVGRLRYLLSAPVTPAPAREPTPAPTSPPPAADPVPPAATPAVEVAEPPAEVAEAEAALSAALESLGKAHHRPFSRG